MSRRLVPNFILEKYAAGDTGGSFMAASLFVDISGFTAASDALMSLGQEGGERLAEIMDATFAPLVDSVYNCHGFITGFAGDAFTALFPEVEDSPPAVLRALAAAQQMQAATVNRRHRLPPAGEFQVALKLGVAAGSVDWGILVPADSDFTAEPTVGYYFTGTAIQESGAAEDLAAPGELVVSRAIWRAIEPFCQGEAAGDYIRVTALDPLGLPLKPQVPPLPGPAELAPFVPDTVRQFNGRGEFRDIVTVFIDFKDRSAGQAFAGFVQTIFNLQKSYGGYLNTIHFGDKGSNLLLFWGMPTSFENDIDRALQFVNHLNILAPGLFRAGITYRAMFAGFVGTQQRQEYSCYGRGINLAARLMSHAAWGEVWLDDAAAAQAGPHFQLQPIGRFAFKGFVDSHKVHEFLGPRESAAADYQGHLVGRQADLARLAQFLRPLGAGLGTGLMVVWGEAGIGKSRLLHTIQQTHRADDDRANPFRAKITPQWVTCPSDPILRASLNPFKYWLRRYFKQKQRVASAVNEAAFARQWAVLRAGAIDDELTAELERTRPFLEDLLNLPGTVDWTRQLDAKTRFDNTLAALTALLLAESRRQPLVLILEDANWLDDDSALLVGRLLQEGQNGPIAVIAAARQDERAWLAPIKTEYQELNLGQLSTAELEHLSAEVLKAPAAPALIELLADRSDGNPFFAEQILLFFGEQGLLRPGPAGQIELRGQPDLALTMDLRALLVARLDRLSPAVKEVVQTAAVLGREFDVNILTQMCRDDPGVHDKIAAAEAAAVWCPVNGSRYSFHHALLRDAAYQMQLRARRRQLHALAAQTLEDVFAAELPAHYDELAYHFEKAELLPQARYYLEEAAARAAAAYQNQPALDYCRRLLATFGPNEPLSREASQIFIRAQTIQARLYQHIGDWPQAEAAFRAALTQAEVNELPEAAGSLRSSMGELMRLKGHYETALAYHHQALDLFQYVGDTTAIARVLGNMGLVHARRGEYDRALDYYDQAQRHAQSNDNRPEVARMLNNIGIVRKNQGELAAAAVDMRQALNLYQQESDLQGMQMALGNLGNIQRGLGNLAAALASFGDGLRLAQQLGSRRSIALFYGNMGTLFDQMGDHEAALHHFERALAIERELGNREGIARNLSNIGQVHLSRQSYAAALDYLERTLPMIRQLNAQYPLAETLIRQAQALLGLHRPVQAQLSNDEGVQIADTIGARRLAFIGQLQAARIQAALDQPGVVDRLHWLLGQTDDLEEQAQIYFELWQLTSGGDFAQAALARYEQLDQTGRQIKNDQQQALLAALADQV